MMRDETERPKDDVPGGSSDYGDEPTETSPQGGDEGLDETAYSGGDEGPSAWDGGGGPGDPEPPGNGGLGGY
ncbi:MAG TPA: hypothetical protein VJT74_00915 [Pyrinomonadaceae bacterium]|nr:hypothetical protein [Pyrinomonadaceae bacterium]